MAFNRLAVGTQPFRERKREREREHEKAIAFKFTHIDVIGIGIIWLRKPNKQNLQMKFLYGFVTLQTSAS